ncbi:MAG: hypothetical protein QXP42_00950 [Candidatus Micrarchaeia archaeon]
MRAQVSFEYISLFTLLLIPLAVAFLYSYAAVFQATSAYKIETSLDKLAQNAEELYVQGPGAKSIVTIDLPSGINAHGSFIGNSSGGPGRYIMLNFSGSNAVRITRATVQGYWPNTTGGYVRPGILQMNLTVDNNNIVIMRPLRSG